MLMYIILDWSTDIILWLIKNIGRTGYYSICYLFGEPEKLDHLKELIEQKKDIQEIKNLLEELKKK